MKDNSRTKNSILNISTGLCRQMITLIVKFVSRTLFIKILGDECLGLNGLFTSILSMLSLADLGIGQAITFYLYKPIADKDEEKVLSILKFYKLCYRIIGVAIFVMGLILIPALPKLVNLDIETGYNLYHIYILYLINTCITYLFFSYPQTILIANQNEHIVNNNESIFVIVSACVEVIVLIWTRNYIYYLISRISIAVLKNLILMIKTIKLYPFISKRYYNKLEKNEIKHMFRDVYSIFVVRTSSQLFNSTDNLFISALFGTVLTGYNSNYLMIINQAYALISTFIYSFAGSVGNLYATESKEKTERVFSNIDFLNRCISCIFTVCLFQLLNPFITIVWGGRYTFSMVAVSLMCADFYIVSSLYNLFNFRQSMGLFKYCVYNQLIAAVINIILDFVFAKIFGIVGLFMATIVSKSLVSVFTYITNFYKYGFGKSARSHIYKVLKGYLTCILSCTLCGLICTKIQVNVVGFIVMVLASVIVPLGICVLFNLRDSDFRDIVNKVTNIKTLIIKK